MSSLISLLIANQFLMRMLLGLADALPSLVEAKFRSAKATSSLTFSPTELAIIRTSTGIPFQLRYCPSLAKKPTALKVENAAPKKKFNPFENPDADLHVADIPATNPSHQIILNKFPIIAEHFILATKANKRQTQVLEQDDLEATYASLKAWQTEGKQQRLFAFFNSGEHSGASQPHRHLQFLPVEKMRAGERSAGWDLLLDLILASPTTDKGAQQGLKQHSAIPFAHFGYKFSSEPTGPYLVQCYNNLYSAAKDAVDKFIDENPEQLALHSIDNGDLPLSYNLAMTVDGMAIMPRRAEASLLRHDNGSEIGLVALNGTTLGGTLMVKYQEQWDMLRSRPEKLDAILRDIGIPKDPQSSKARV